MTQHTPDRYGADIDGQLMYCPDGEYIYYSEYQRLEKQRDELEKLVASQREANEGMKAGLLKAVQQRDELLEALINHQEQTRPIQRSIEAIAKAGNP